MPIQRRSFIASLAAPICAGAATVSARGSLSLWAQPDQDVKTFGSGRHMLFERDGIFLYLGNSNPSRADMGDQPLLRFAAAGQEVRFFIPARVAWWLAGEWWHIAVNWDAATGELSAVVNGRPMPLIDQHNGSKMFARVPWTPLPASRAIRGTPWPGKVEDVRVGAQPLTLEEARREFLRRGREQIEVRPLDAFLFAGRQERFRLTFENPSAKALTIAPEIPGVGKFGRISIPPHQAVTVPAKLRLAQAGDHRIEVRFGEELRRIDVTAIDPRVPQAPPQDRLQLVADIDVVEQTPIAESAPSRIVESPSGRYREAGPRRHDRFAIAFTVKDLTQPHVAVIEYPDDKVRTMETLLQRLVAPGDPGDYQAQTGVLCGGEYPLSNRFQEHRVVFWPTAEKLSFIFMTGENERPAALRRMRIYRLEGGFSRAGARGGRGIGIYFEDPVLNKSFSTGALMPEFAATTDRLLDYMQWSGQDTLHYPLVWYHGPLYGSLAEPFEGDIATRPHFYDFPRYLMKRLEVRGMTFNGGLHIHELASLLPHVLTDQNRVLSGEETIINVQANDKLKLTGFHGNDTSFNPIDPRVQRAVKQLVAEIADRYGDEPAFTGITLVTARLKLFTFNTLDSGYNDSNLRRFQKDTGIRIPVESSDRKRFSKSYEWLMGNARSRWIEWRCRQILAFWKELAATLAAKRPDLTLTVNLFPHLVHGRKLAAYQASAHPLRDVLMEAGIDPDLFAGEKNIVLSYTTVPADSRWLRTHPYRNMTGAEARTTATAPEIMSALRLHPQGAATKIHDRYFEDAIGKEKPMAGLGVTEQVWRVSTLNPAHLNALEEYALPLAHFDSLEIVKGGFVIGTLGMEDRLRKFSAEFRKLPAVRFDDVAGLDDPVRVRQKVVGRSAHFYVVNTLPAEVQVTLRLAGEEDLRLRLEPYGLRTFQRDSAAPPVQGGQVSADPAFVAALEQQLREAERKVGQSPFLRVASECWKARRYARLFRLLQESWNQ
jgi:hypothetical protein